MAKHKLIKFYPLISSLLFIGILSISVFTIKKLGYHITYCNSSSVPKGFYFIVPTMSIMQNDIVELVPPKNSLIGENCTILKPVVALYGNHVCIRENNVFVDQHIICVIKKYYAPGKKLPRIEFCNYLNVDQYFVISKHPRSFDSRYFGVISKENIKGRAIAIFTL